MGYCRLMPDVLKNERSDCEIEEHKSTAHER
jgi:hypothetical protein